MLSNRDTRCKNLVNKTIQVYLYGKISKKTLTSLQQVNLSQPFQVNDKPGDKTIGDDRCIYQSHD